VSSTPGCRVSPTCTRQAVNSPLMARRLAKCPVTDKTPLSTLALTWVFVLERVTGIEPALSAWEADVLPLNYTRAHLQSSVVATTEPACAVFAQTSYRTG
jgi:hypothetical protein